MDYLFLFRGGRPAASASPEDMQRHMEKWRTWIDGLGKQGLYKGGEPLDQTGKVVRDHGKHVTDGPYAESKDVIGGYLLVTADSLDKAAGIAHGCPIFDVGGTVEVRPLMKM